MPDEPARLVETHTAVVTFIGDRVYKLKKPVNLGFVDFSTREAREQACRQEVELNRRLAPDVYLGVADVSGPDGSPWDHLVVMRRLPEGRRLSSCLADGEDCSEALGSVARQIASLHARSPRDPGQEAHARRDAVRGRWTDGFAQLAPFRGRLIDPAVEDGIEQLALAYLTGRDDLFAARVAGGHIRDGHGDLQADDIFLLEDGPRILDCLDFDAGLRWGDGLLDVAFLAMDLERLGHPREAAGFLAAYQELTADRWPASLARHYMAYRAHVRAKVAAIRADQVGAPNPLIAELQDLALRLLRRAEVRLIMVGGLPGTGKSTLARAVADPLDAVVLRTDEIRTDENRGRPEGADRYSPEAVDATYRQMRAEARRLLSLGHSVVLDATWADADQRRRARALATETASALAEVVCVAPPAVSHQRIAERLRRGVDPSEATPAIAEALAARFASWPEATEVTTDGPPDRAKAAALAAITAHH